MCVYIRDTGICRDISREKTKGFRGLYKQMYIDTCVYLLIYAYIFISIYP